MRDFKHKWKCGYFFIAFKFNITTHNLSNEKSKKNHNAVYRVVFLYNKRYLILG